MLVVVDLSWVLWPQSIQCFQTALWGPVMGVPSPHSHRAGEVGISHLRDHGRWGGWTSLLRHWI